jgi:hypothetical protein
MEKNSLLVIKNEVKATDVHSAIMLVSSLFLVVSVQVSTSVNREESYRTQLAYFKEGNPVVPTVLLFNYCFETQMLSLVSIMICLSGFIFEYIMGLVERLGSKGAMIYVQCLSWLCLIINLSFEAYICFRMTSLLQMSIATNAPTYRFYTFGLSIDQITETTRHINQWLDSRDDFVFWNNSNSDFDKIDGYLGRVASGFGLVTILMLPLSLILLIPLFFNFLMRRKSDNDQMVGTG